MPVFAYKALNREGEVIEGIKEADDEASLVKSLQNDGCIPISVGSAGLASIYKSSFGKKNQGLSPKDILLFTKELATLLDAGLPLDRSLVVLMDLIPADSKIYQLINKVLERVKGGATLAASLEAESTAFSKFYLNMLRAGEAGGSVEVVLRRLADYLEKSKELRNTVTTAMIYPAILVVMALGSVFLLLTFVVPQFMEMFESAGKELPVSTQIVVGAAQWLQNYWWVLLLMIVMGTGFMRYELSDSPRKPKWDAFFLRIPIVGDMIRNIATASFSRTLGTLLSNGVPILTALGIVKSTLSNQVLVNAVSSAEDNLRQGKDMSGALIATGQFPKMATQMIKMGEETGRMEEMLDRIAVAYDKQLEITIKRMLALMEPAVIVFMGVMIGGIIISILSAILSVNDLAF
jgi:general secretion pathway protein F